MTLTSLVQFLFNATLSDVVGSLTNTSTTRVGVSSDFTPITISNGSGLNQASKVYSKKLTITGGANVNIDLQALPYPNDPSATPDNLQSLTRVVLVLVVIPFGSTAKARLGGAATNAWEGFTSVAGSKWDVVDMDFKLNRTVTGFVVDATHKNLKVENYGTTGDIHVAILGS